MIHNRIALARTEAKISRTDLAKKVGVNPQTIGFIERGDYSPSLELAFKVAEAFDLEITDLFSDKEFKPLIGRRKNDKER